MRRSRKLAVWTAGALLSLLILTIGLGLAILPSSWLSEQVRSRIVFETERATGGRAEAGAFRFDWRNLTAEVAPFVLHGTEPPGARPLFRARSVKVGLKIISALRSDVDIQTLVVEQPQVNILVDANGKTNFPEPRLKNSSNRNPIEQIIALAVGNIELRDGELRYGNRRTNLNLKGENLRALLKYNSKGLHYQGDVSMRQLEISGPGLLPVKFDFDGSLALFGDRIRVEHSRFTKKRTTLEVSGELIDFSDPKLSFDVHAAGSLDELAGPMNLPVEHAGTIRFDGKMTYSAADRLRFAGNLTGEGLAYRQARTRLSNVSIRADLQYGNGDLSLRGLRVKALGGAFSGMADFPGLKNFKLNGKLDGVSLAAAARSQGWEDLPFSGSASGPVQAEGTLSKFARDVSAAGKLTLQGAQEGIPANGFVEFAYNQHTGKLQLGDSWIDLPSTQLKLNGTAGEQLNIRLESRDLNNILPSLAMLGERSPGPLPFQLRTGGSAVFQGTLAGSLNSARLAGTLTLASFAVQDQKFDNLAAAFEATSNGAHVTSFALGQDALRLNGSANLALQNWKLTGDSAVSANVRIEGARLAKLLTNTGQKLPVDGTLTAAMEISGTSAAPKAVMQVAVGKGTAYGQPFDRFTGELNYSGTRVELRNGIVHLDDARLQVSGSYEHAKDDWKNGRLRFNAQSAGLPLQKLAALQTFGAKGRGRAGVQASGVVAVRKGEFYPEDVSGDLNLRDLVVDGRPIGSFSINAKTAGQQLKLAIAGNLRGSKVTGGARFQLAGDYPGSGEIEFTPMTLSTLQDLAVAARGREPLPLEGLAGGKVSFSGPARNPALIRARFELPVFNLTPARRTMTAAQAAELSLHNEGPVVFEYGDRTVQVVSAHLIGKDTNLRASGAIRLENAKSPLGMKVEGNLNLGVLQNFNTDIVSSGAATVAADIRGSLNDPQVNGRLEFKQASFYLTDVPNGLDNTDGVILFDTRRATIEKLTAITGGGNIALNGFVGFGNPELSYRLQARAEGVRVRYPEGVSTTLNAQLNLTGTSAHSLLAGVVTVRRAGFNPRTDVGGLLAASVKPIETPVTPNEFLRGMQLDVRVETIPNLQLQTALTSDLEAEAEMRIRGTAAKPAVLGRVVVNEGEIQFFGNKYTINRGEIGFFNPASIEPVLDLDLETRVRGITVNISVVGSLKKLNVSYRSDPPLQSSEIIALLAVGRAPQSTSSLAATQTAANQAVFALGGNSLLGNAVSAPVSGRLERFFGVSRLRIDPQLTGLNAVPQARLTVEQQISRDITLTYITNLSQANQQIIRLEWDISRKWSVVALREENGAFGIDFFYKRRIR